MHRFWAFHLVLFSIYSEMASWSCSSEHWWKGKSLGHRGSRDRSLIILSTLIPCTHNPPGIEQQQDFYEVNHLQGPKVKSTLLSIYELLSAVLQAWPPAKQMWQRVKHEDWQLWSRSVLGAEICSVFWVCLALKLHYLYLTQTIQQN